MSIFANEKEVFQIIGDDIVTEDFLDYSEREHGVLMYIGERYYMSAYYNGFKKDLRVEGGADLFAYCIWEYIKKTNQSVTIKIFTNAEEEFNAEYLEVDEIKEKLLFSNVVVFGAFGFEVKRIDNDFEEQKPNFLKRMIQFFSNLIA